MKTKKQAIKYFAAYFGITPEIVKADYSNTIDCMVKFANEKPKKHGK